MTRTIFLVVASLVMALPVLASADGESTDPHEELLLENRFPSANTCATCHPDHYREWSVSPHAYSQMSPIFNAFHGTVLAITNGTNGDFCIRCHTPVGMNLGEPQFMSNMDRNATSREGVTCIVCHRVKNAYGKVSGRLAIVEGDLFDPVYGPTDGSSLQELLDSNEIRVQTERGKPGRAIHTEVKQLTQLENSGSCGTCHDVNLVNGFRLEEAFSEFKNSPSAAREESCQDCHMASDPGKVSDYASGPAAIVGGVSTPDRKRTNHMFIGPDYSVIHPGIFPHNVEAAEMATIREWLTFDHEAGWGTPRFERSIPKGYRFPEHWRSPDDRYDARDILNDNFELLAEADRDRVKILQAGYVLGDVIVEEASTGGLEFTVPVKNATDGHGVPTGFDAERMVFLQVTVTNKAGETVFISGDLDPNGDVRDAHSLYVHNGELPEDPYLFTLQSKFITRMVRGGEREQVLALNYSPDPLPFLRPSTSSTILTGRPGGARKFKRNIEPGGERRASYEVSGDALSGPGPYNINVKIIAGMIPVNLVPEIQGVGFDYGMSPMEIAKAVVAGHRVLWQQDVEVTLE